MSSRLTSGGLIDRSRVLSFKFDGRDYTGHPGDTLASALMANGVRLVARSFKYHRPRGILSAGSSEPNALVTLREGARAEPNIPATTIELYDGLVATSQNRWPSLKFDALAVNQLFGPMLVAGFYYKTFMWPAGLWEKLYEPAIRRAAGLGALSGLEDPDTYDQAHGFADLLVVGGGPAGLIAALGAARAGARVILADEGARMGGQALAERGTIDGQAAAHWVDGVLAELTALPNVRLMPRTTVFGRFEGAEYGAVERVSDHLLVPLPGQPRQRLWKITATRTIMATGATERPIVFDGNDRPGVMLAGAVSAYIRRYGTVPGARAVVVIAADSGWEVAEDLLEAGAELAAVIDLRGAMPEGVAARMRASGAVVIEGGAVIAAHGSAAVRGITLAGADGTARRFACDLVAMAGGWNPNLALAAHLGERPVWDEALAAYLPADAGELIAAGAAAGRFGLASALASGAEALRMALGHEVALPAAIDAPHGQAAIWQSGPCKGAAFVDFQHDVTAKDVALAAREGFTSVEHAKRYTTLGMATDQGRVGQVNGHGLLGAATGRSMAEVGTIRPRPPVTPVAIAAFAAHHRGAHFRPVRRTPSHDWAAAQGAVFIDAGQWKRAQWFPLPGETEWRTSVDREVKAVRGGVGLCDVSTLGKIELTGPDVGQLLDRLYINTMSSLRIGRARYGVMLREDGGVLDDGTVTRFADGRWFLTTTTANAARVMQHLDFARQAIWPDYDVQAASVTEHWATYAVAGPRARDLLSAAFPDADLTNAAVPYMAATTLRWEGRQIRLTRLSFSGELAYEAAIAAQHGAALLGHLTTVGEAFGLVPYGTEALGVMRIEKGHAAGGELNGTVTAADLGMARMMAPAKDFIGKQMAARPGMADPARPRLVGLKPLDGSSPIRAGAHLIRPGAAPVTANDEGYVTSACFSPMLGHPIALALLAHGAERHGETVVAHDPVRGADVIVQVCDPVFYDPEGARLRG